jgi:hypothetical protein
VASKRAKKKQRRAARAADPNEVRRERLEARRQAKAEALAKKQKAERRAKAIRRSIALVLIAGLAWFIFFRNTRPSEIAGNELVLFSDSGVANETSHVPGDVDYPMNPPVRGNHDPQAMPCGTYAEQPDPEQMVHALEHGAVGLLYDPEAVEPEAIADLEGLVGDYDSHVFSAPYPGIPKPFVIVSWGEMMQLDDRDVPAIREYIDTFRDKGPEPGVNCPPGENDTFEPAPEETPTPSPSPTDSDEDKKNDDKKKKDKDKNN